MTINRFNASVVVATRNRIGLLADLLRSLARAEPSPVEVVVVDDGSQPPVALNLPEGGFPFDLRMIREKVSVGPGAARNLGVHNSRGDVIAFTDDDCTVDPSCLGNLARGLEEASRTGWRRRGGGRRGEGRGGCRCPRGRNRRP